MFNALKSVILLVAVAVASLSLGGCATYRFNNQIREMGIAKVRAMPAIGDNVNGFGGFLHNTRGHTYRFDVRAQNGADLISTTLLPRQISSEKLLPGGYDAVVYDRNGREQARFTFTVGSRVFNYQGMQAHWYVYY